MIGFLRLDVSVEDSLAVDELEPLDELVEVLLDAFLLEWLLSFLDVLIHVSLHQFEHQCQPLFGLIAEEVTL